MQQKIKEILSNLNTPYNNKPIMELAELTSVVEGDGFYKIQLQFDAISSDEKRILRKFIEDTLSQHGIEVLVNIVTKDHKPQKPAQSGNIQEFIPADIFKKFKKIIAVYSTKGGVGKSTISANLALELSQKLKVAVVDLDVYGPSIPRVLGVNEEIVVHEEKFVPMDVNGMHVMSVGFLIPSVDSPLVWRAPIANSVVKQLFVDTLWDNEYDVMVIDMPPGTGDIPIILGQSIPVDGIVSVSTPQGVALEDTLKGISMLNKFSKNIYGMVFNMGSVVCADCQSLMEIFPKNKEMQEILAQYNIQEIANLPLDKEVAMRADKGELDELDEKSVWKQEFAKITDFVYAQITK